MRCTCFRFHFAIQMVLRSENERYCSSKMAMIFSISDFRCGFSLLGVSYAGGAISVAGGADSPCMDCWTERFAKKWIVLVIIVITVLAPLDWSRRLPCAERRCPSRKIAITSAKEFGLAICWFVAEVKSNNKCRVSSYGILSKVDTEKKPKKTNFFRFGILSNVEWWKTECHWKN